MILSSPDHAPTPILRSPLFLYRATIFSPSHFPSHPPPPTQYRHTILTYPQISLTYLSLPLFCSRFLWLSSSLTCLLLKPLLLFSQLCPPLLHSHSAPPLLSKSRKFSDAGQTDDLQERLAWVYEASNLIHSTRKRAPTKLRKETINNTPRVSREEGRMRYSTGWTW